MIPYLLAVAGGYLIGNSMNETTPQFGKGGMMAKKYNNLSKEEREELMREHIGVGRTPSSEYEKYEQLSPYHKELVDKHLAMAKGGGVKAGQQVWEIMIVPEGDIGGSSMLLQDSTYEDTILDYKNNKNWEQTADQEFRKVFVHKIHKTMAKFTKKYVYADGGMMAKGGVNDSERCMEKI